MVELKNIDFKYHSNSEQNGISGMNLSVGKGEFIVLCGRSGCGKTTVTRLINGLIPHFFEGELDGEVIVGDLNVTEGKLSSVASLVGSVFQNPSSQFFNIDTTSELAFGCENRAMDREEIKERIDKTVRELSLEKLMDRSIFELSGGEKQQIACGSVHTTEPKVYVLDEPSSNMDVSAIKRLKKILTTLKKEGKTVILSEHRLYYLTELADRFLYMENGRILREYSKEEMSGLGKEELSRLGLRTLNLETVEYEGEIEKTLLPEQTEEKEGERSEQDTAIFLKNFSVIRGKRELLNIPELEFPKNAVIAVIGENGVGKSTLVQALSGLIVSKGKVFIAGKALGRKARLKKSFMVMQDVNNQLFCETVKEEVGLNLDEASKEGIEPVLYQLGLSEVKDRHPATLSGGQKQRTAIASAVCGKKQMIFYDEPTSGLDHDGMRRFCDLMKKNGKEHAVSFIITHDLELIMGCCTHVCLLNGDKTVTFYPLNEKGVRSTKDYFISRTV